MYEQSSDQKLKVSNESSGSVNRKKEKKNNNQQFLPQDEYSPSRLRSIPLKDLFLKWSEEGCQGLWFELFTRPQLTLAALDKVIGLQDNKTHVKS